MRNEVLRDVLAGCAGVLAVAAVIGLPRASEAAQQPTSGPPPQYVLLPYFPPRVAPAHPVPKFPSQPRPKLTTGP
jgi:hypothetical protein